MQEIEFKSFDFNCALGIVCIDLRSYVKPQMHVQVAEDFQESCPRFPGKKTIHFPDLVEASKYQIKIEKG